MMILREKLIFYFIFFSFESPDIFENVSDQQSRRYKRLKFREAKGRKTIILHCSRTAKCKTSWLVGHHDVSVYITRISILNGMVISRRYTRIRMNRDQFERG